MTLQQLHCLHMQMAFSMQSLAHEAALAAAKRAGKVSKSIDAAASPNQDYASDAAKQVTGGNEHVNVIVDKHCSVF